jgi:CRISPR system Cascade subunit CasB
MSEIRLRDEKPDFIQIKKNFDKVLTNGQRADIRRVRLPEDLNMIPAFYRLLLPNIRPNRQWQRVVFMLPYADHSETAGSLGHQLADGKVSEARLFQMIRSEEPQDLLHLRRLCQQTKPSVNWQYFGETLYFWGDKMKRYILQQYYLSETLEKEETTK